MSAGRSRKAKLDHLERKLTGPKRIALFGHRAVGKTTLLSMFYREASTGRVPGVRLAARGAATANYLAEKIAQIESGESPAGTLAETELNLTLYHGLARFELVVKDYQGEHVSLGSEAPIREFFADCDAVFLCLDLEGGATAPERRRRQQEVEELLEHYIEASDDGTAGRPVAVLTTKYDRVLAAGGPPPAEVERLIESHYGMTRHALAQHAPRAAIFAVSSFGRGGQGDRPPAELHPMGLEGPLLWLAEQLETIDREQFEWIWDLDPDDLPRLARCLRAFEKRYPSSDRLGEYHEQLAALRRRRRKRLALRLAAGAAVIAGGLALYDAVGYRTALAFESRANPPAAVERRWQEFVAWHPSHGLFWPSQARAARRKLQEWTVKAAAQRVAAGTAAPDLPTALGRLKEEAPELVADIRRVEHAQAARQHEERWKALRGEDLAGGQSTEATLAAYRAFIREFPETTHLEEARRRIEQLSVEVANQRVADERRDVDALLRDAALPEADLAGIVEKARLFLEQHSDSPWRDDVETLLTETVRRIDDRDIQKARDFSRNFPTNFPTRRRRYEEYLAAHQNGGRYVREALEAIDAIDSQRDTYTYRLAFDHAQAHPDDVAEVARRLRTYLDANPQGRFASAAREYLAWWEKISRPGEYRVQIKHGEVEPDVGKYFNGGGPDLAVEIWVAGVKYGPCPIAPNTRNPIWNFTFPRPIRWKYGDPVVIRILDFDWSSTGTGVFRLASPKDDPLAMRHLSGQVRPSKGGRTRLVFASDFRIPTLPRPG